MPDTYDANHAVLSSDGRYSQFSYNGKTIIFMHGKDLIKYLAVKEWDKGYLVVDCLGRIKGEYEDYIDITYLLKKLYMDPEEFVKDIKEVMIKNG